MGGCGGGGVCVNECGVVLHAYVCRCVYGCGVGVGGWVGVDATLRLLLHL